MILICIIRAEDVLSRMTRYTAGWGGVYDAAGNALYDSHAGLNLRYNHLNLVEKGMRDDTIVVKYSYLSDGTKLSATDSAGNGLYYSGTLVYSKHGRRRRWRAAHSLADGLLRQLPESKRTI